MDCPFCGGSNPEGAKFCMHCSGPLEQRPKPSVSKPASDPTTQPMTAPLTPQMGKSPTPVTPGATPGVPGATPGIPAAGSAKPLVPSHLVWAILTTLFCCLPFGIVAIVYASQVSSKLAAGDIEGATEASGKAKTWCWVSFGVGLFFTFAYIVLAVIAEMADI